MMMDLGTSGDNDCSVEAHFFASHEGKSDSDTAGSLEKLRAQRIMLRNKNLVITNAAQLVQAMHDHDSSVENSATAKYSFRVVEEFSVLSRIPLNQRSELRLPGIRKIHFMSSSSAGFKVRGISCLLCWGQEVNCTECSASKARFSLDQVKAALSNPDEEDDEG